MNKLTALALLAATSLLGCGVEADTAGNVYADAPTALQSPESLPEPVPQKSFPTVEAVVQPVPNAQTLAPPQLTVKGKGLSSPDGHAVTVISGLLSCGFLETGSGEGVMSNGTFAAPLVRTWEDYGYESVYVFIDHDADGVCDTEKGDDVFHGAYSVNGYTVSLDAADLLPIDGWECGIFNYREVAP